ILGIESHLFAWSFGILRIITIPIVATEEIPIYPKLRAIIHVHEVQSLEQQAVRLIIKAQISAPSPEPTTVALCTVVTRLTWHQTARINEIHRVILHVSIAIETLWIT